MVPSFGELAREVYWSPESNTDKILEKTEMDGCWEVRLKAEFSLSKNFSRGHAKHKTWSFFLFVFSISNYFLI